MTVSQGRENVAIVVPDRARYTELSHGLSASVGAEGESLGDGSLVVTERRSHHQRRSLGEINLNDLRESVKKVLGLSASVG